MAEIPAGPADSGAVSGSSRGAALAERYARRRLEQADLRFVAANRRIRSGEIDLIMLDRFTWVFVEVRYRRSDGFDTAACRFDIIAITGNRVEWLRDAFVAP
ncbi:YraN family protein [Sodalis-like symbiont of Bactericera trigonica]|nr:YraN family protein [Sodalis-like symbiont of Bactericera trigonica]